MSNQLQESKDLLTDDLTTYDWDDAGRLITTTVAGVVDKVYQYSQDGDLIRAEVDGLVTTFAYDGRGSRLQMSVAGEMTTYLPDYGGRQNRVLFEQGPEETKHYLYGAACLGEFVTNSVTSDTEWRYYQRDGNSLVRQTTNETATITLAWTFSPEGGVLLGEEGPVTHLGCGDDAVYDWSTGLIFKSGRYFDPNNGIWITMSGAVIWHRKQTSSRRKRRQSKRNRRLMMMFLLIILVLALTGCGDPTPEPTEDATCPPPTETPGLPTETPPPPPPPTNTPPPSKPSKKPLPLSVVEVSISTPLRSLKPRRGTAVAPNAFLTSNHWLPSDVSIDTITSVTLRTANNDFIAQVKQGDFNATGYLGNERLGGGLGLMVFKNTVFENFADLGNASNLQIGDIVYQAVQEGALPASYPIKVFDRGDVTNLRGTTYETLTVEPSEDRTIGGDSGMGLFDDSLNILYAANNSGKGNYGPINPSEVHGTIASMGSEMNK